MYLFRLFAKRYYEENIAGFLPSWQDAHLHEFVDREGLYSSQGPESFHSAMLRNGTRDLPLAQIPQTFLKWQFDRLNKLKTGYEKLHTAGKRLGPKMRAKWDTILKGSNPADFTMTVTELGRKAILSRHDSPAACEHIVDLGSAGEASVLPSCSCKHLNLTSLPCSAMAAFAKQIGTDPLKYARSHVFVKNTLNGLRLALDGFIDPAVVMAEYFAFKPCDEHGESSIPMVTQVCTMLLVIMFAFVPPARE